MSLEERDSRSLTNLNEPQQHPEVQPLITRIVIAVTGAVLWVIIWSLIFHPATFAAILFLVLQALCVLALVFWFGALFWRITRWIFEP